MRKFFSFIGILFCSAILLGEIGLMWYALFPLNKEILPSAVVGLLAINPCIQQIFKSSESL